MRERNLKHTAPPHIRVPSGDMAIAMACQTWAERQGSEAIAAASALVNLRGSTGSTAKAVARRLRNFLVQATFASINSCEFSEVSRMRMFSWQTFLCSSAGNTSKHAYTCWVDSVWSLTGAVMNRGERSRNLLAFSQLAPSVKST